tara:strand:+ start:70 stop:675 length:606 start_codon:yes stop_codon:yes gene_type:complete
MEAIFTNIYNKNHWGNNHNSNYYGSSGGGSDITYNKEYIVILRKIINDLKINKIVDLGCGDFRIGNLLYNDLNILYIGYDTYAKIIEFHKTQYLELKYTFKHLDFFTNKELIEKGDLCILKDVLQHWTLKDIYAFLDYLVESNKFKYILLINCCNQSKDNTDCQIGCTRELSCNFLPLKKYNIRKIANYNTKEISIIDINK